MASQEQGGKRFRGELAWIGGILGACLLLFAVYAVFQMTRDPAPDIALPVMQPVETAPVDPVAPDQVATDTASDTGVPGFDLVRVEPDGAALVAGLAAPGSQVKILVDGDEVSVAKADSSGNFVAQFTMPQADATHVVTLAVPGADDTVITSAQSVIVAPVPDANGAKVVANSPSEPAVSTDSDTTANMDTTSTATTGADAATPGAPSATETTADGSSAVADGDLVTSPGLAEVTDPGGSAPAVLLADSQGISVLQDGGAGLGPTQNVIIDSISYDDAGEVQLAGRGREAATVRVYLDNKPVTTARIAGDGQWRLPLPDVEIGIYTLRVDELSDDGTVISRSQTPFKREAPAELSAAAANVSGGVGIAPVQALTVQPGNTLWAIARDNFGEGLLYVRVFEANRDKIRDPDLIYPGQVFTIPSD